MKKLLTAILLTILIVMTSYSQEITADKVPARVKQSFTKQFPAAKMIKYEQDNSDYIISFFQQGKQFIITFNNAGQVTASDKEIDPAKLPAEVSASAEKNFPGYQIMTAIKREAVDKGICYEMDLKKEGAGYSVRFSEQGEILQKVARTVEFKVQTNPKR
ncbi:MAG: PepSY-like domain-containing protein [Bacteroidales bacterium]|jgi:biopolymer transport protein ExbD